MILVKGVFQTILYLQMSTLKDHKVDAHTMFPQCGALAPALCKVREKDRPPRKELAKDSVGATVRICTHHSQFTGELLYAA